MQTLNVLSPDGFPIHFADTYKSFEEAKKAIQEWKKNYERQGYYSSTQYGRIPLDELENYCDIILHYNKMEIKVIGFYTQSNDLFIYNEFNDRFDNFLKVDLTESAFKYENATMNEAQMCMQIEGNVGDLQELNLFI